MTEARGTAPEQEFNFVHDGRELRCFTTSPLHGVLQWAVTIGNRTYGTGLPASVGEAVGDVRERIIEWYEFEKARGTFGP
jgi:hypothetical protein